MSPEIPASISFIFIILVIVLIAFIIGGLNAAWMRTGMLPAKRKRNLVVTLIGIDAWLAFLGLLANQNVFNDFSSMPPRLLIVLLPPLIAAVFLARSGTVSSWLRVVPPHWLIFLQSFRIVMELILFLLMTHSIIPVQMTFDGRNFDVLTGVSALIVGNLVYTKSFSFPKWIIAWNVAGLILLANIVGIAILSAPFSFRVFMNDPPNTVIAGFPFVWLPGFVVPVAYCSHILSIKQNTMIVNG